MSQTPGKTQAVHFYLVNDAIFVVDLPGYGYAKVPRAVVAEWGDLINSYLEESSALRVIFVLLDIRRVPTDDDLQMIEWIRRAGRNFQIVLTKADKLSNNQRAASRKVIAGKVGVGADDMILFSKITREGVDRMWRAIDSARNQS